MKEQGKKKLVTKLRDQYRLSVLNETTFEEKISVLLSPLNVIFLLSSIIIFVSGVFYIAIAFTPLKEYIIPDFTDYEYREDAKYSRYVVDSLISQNSEKDQYINNLKIILNGGVIRTDLSDTSATSADQENLEYLISEEDSSLRVRISQEDKYALNLDDSEAKKISGNLIFPFKPINGTVSSFFDPKISHFGIDIVAPKNEVVKAVMDGTVIFSDYTSEGGNVIQVQHSHDLISVYKHNAALFKKTGEYVKAGTSIAVIGESGDHAEGPHLHFEMWQNGVPVDPVNFFVFEEN